MKVDKSTGSGVAKIHIEEDGSYFQVRQVSSSPDDQKHVHAALPSHKYGDWETSHCGQIHCQGHESGDRAGVGVEGHRG